MSATAEQIILDSNEHSITPTEEDRNNVNLEFRQSSKLHDVQQLIQIYDSHFVNVTEKTRKRSRSFMVNLALLNDKPGRIRNIEPKFLISALVMGVLAYMAFYLKSKGIDYFSSSYVYAGIALLATGSIISVILTARSFTNTWVFETARGRIPLIALFHNHPNKQQFHQFISEMINHIVMAKSEIRLSESQIMPLEVGEHRRLRDEGIISKPQYELAKANILQGRAKTK